MFKIFLEKCTTKILNICYDIKDNTKYDKENEDYKNTTNIYNNNLSYFDKDINDNELLNKHTIKPYDKNIHKIFKCDINIIKPPRDNSYDRLSDISDNSDDLESNFTKL